MYVTGALTFLAILGAPDPNTSDHGAILLFAGVEALSAAIVAIMGPRRLASQLTPLWGTLTVSAFIAVAKPIGATPFFYIWPILVSAYFMGRRNVAANLVVLAVSFGAALAFFHNPGDRMILWMGTGVSVVLLGIVMTLLRERIDRLVAELHEISSTDPLTGLLNRRCFASIFETELERAGRSGGPLTLAMFDLDNFKQVNDRFGHAAGDRALCHFAELLRAEQRRGDAVARMGGEEFAVLLVDSDGDGAQRYAERLAATLNSSTAADEVQLAVSVGVASRDERLQTQDALLQAADAALYQAKAAGRNRVALHGGAITITPAGERTADVEAAGPTEPVALG